MVAGGVNAAAEARAGVAAAGVVLEAATAPARPDEVDSRSTSGRGSE